ncbi:hypothetical protein JW949_00190 [Candidatus Woesearchaeota archaeon]|nr:hypothetical protein [Candidatus Woesearchaeota archaeon]
MIKMEDFVFYNKKKAKEFLEIAEKLNYKQIVFILNNEKDKKELKDLDSDIKIKTAFFLSGNRRAGSYKNKFDFIIAPPERNYFEDKHVDIIINMEMSSKRDSFHFRNSGLNQVRCKLAREKDIILGFNFSSLLKADFITKIILIGRMLQNSRICNKYNNKCFVRSFAHDPFEMRSYNDFKNFEIVLGLKKFD